MSTRSKINYDRLGIFTSIACAIHCTLLPLFISSIPFLGMDVLEHKGIEWSMILLALLFGVLSLYHGYKQHHHKLLPLFLFGIGFMFLLLNQLIAERLVYLFIPVSVICIISAHSLNLFYNRKAQNKMQH
ncbi:MAG: MerC domain-containing protein [Chitinophagaceae bacterium]|nr:MerC domain-containing protein [Chitinophagaceae bacterium]